MAARTYFLEEGAAVHPRHLEVENNDVVVLLGNLVQSVHAVVVGCDNEALGRQTQPHYADQCRVIIDYQDLRGLVGRNLVPTWRYHAGPRSAINRLASSG